MSTERPHNKKWAGGRLVSLIRYQSDKELSELEAEAEKWLPLPIFENREHPHNLEQGVFDQIDLNKIMGAMEKLTPRQSEILTLYYLQDRTLEAIAQRF